MNIDRSLDFPIYCRPAMCQKADEKKKNREDEQTLEELNLARHCSQAKCQLVQTSYNKRVKLFFFCHIINILLIKLSWSVWENLDLSRVYRPHCVQSVLMTSVKILPYRPAAQLLRAIIIHQTHYEKPDWSRAFNQFTIACELDMIMQYLLQIFHLSCQVQRLPGYQAPWSVHLRNKMAERLMNVYCFKKCIIKQLLHSVFA